MIQVASTTDVFEVTYIYTTYIRVMSFRKNSQNIFTYRSRFRYFPPFTTIRRPIVHYVRIILLLSFKKPRSSSDLHRTDDDTGKQKHKPSSSK